MRGDYGSEKVKKPKIKFTLGNILMGAQEFSFAQLSTVKLLTAALDIIKELPASKQLDIISCMNGYPICFPGSSEYPDLGWNGYFEDGQ